MTQTQNTLERCLQCQARVGQTADGYKCMNPRCGYLHSLTSSERDCACGTPMNYSGLNTYGMSVFVCPNCKTTASD
jgi:hypothetical protein